MCLLIPSAHNAYTPQLEPHMHSLVKGFIVTYLATFATLLVMFGAKVKEGFELRHESAVISFRQNEAVWTDAEHARILSAAIEWHANNM